VGGERTVVWLFLKINLLTTISMKRSRRELFIHRVIQRGIFKNNQITLSPVSTLHLKLGLIFGKWVIGTVPKLASASEWLKSLL